MRIAYEKKYILSPEENRNVKAFLLFLSQHPLPCQGCKAYEYGKCTSHSIWDRFDSEETCIAYQSWREKHKDIEKDLKIQRMKILRK